LVLGCGDLEYYYLEFIISALDIPLFFVRGNHDRLVEYSNLGQRSAPHGGFDLHRRVVCHKGVILAGVEGSLRYKPGEFQYSQAEMWQHIFTLAPRLMLNRMKYGRYLDIFVSHAPPEGIHDRPDLTHRGIKAFRWLLKVFRPAYHFHGHVHLYRPDDTHETQVGQTWVVNAYPYIEMNLQLDKRYPAEAASSAGSNEHPAGEKEGNIDGFPK
jgi:Icc-related predicted phosphoesterase